MPVGSMTRHRLWTAGGILLALGWLLAANAQNANEQNAATTAANAQNTNAQNAATTAANAQNANAPDRLAAFKSRLRDHLIPVQTLRADFVQTRTLAALDFELTFSGQIAMEKNRRLAWIVHAPMAYVCLLHDRQLTQWDGDSNQVLTISQRSMPWLQALHDTLGSWLAADLEAITRDFSVAEVAETAITLTPRTPFFSDFITTLTIAFTPDFQLAESIFITEVNGDHMRIQFKNSVLNQPIPEDTWQVPPKSKQP